MSEKYESAEEFCDDFKLIFFLPNQTRIFANLL